MCFIYNTETSYAQAFLNHIISGWEMAREEHIKDGKSLTYDQQEAYAACIVSKLVTPECSLLTFTAMMQWGKTGTILKVIYDLCVNKHINPNKVVIITGMSDNDWKDQTKERMFCSFANNVFHRSQLKQPRVRDLFTDMSDALVVLDECHVATAVGQSISSLFATHNITHTTCVEKNINIIQTSATPDGCLIDASVWNPINHQKVCVIDYDGYRGFQQIIDDGCIRKLEKLDNDAAFGRLFTDINSFTEPRYHIIRNSKTSYGKRVSSHIQFWAEENGYAIKHYDSSGQKNITPNDISNIQPQVHTIIFIKNTLRAAKNIE